MTPGLYEFLGGAFFLSGWILIPLLIEILPTIFSCLCLLEKSAPKASECPDFPEITLIIPVYNSERTLESCLESVNASSYPKSKIKVILANNRSKDGSYLIYQRCKQQFSALQMQWIDSAQGKSKALNMALYHSEGKYVIHIDSDGVLHRDALLNMVKKFEANPETVCLSGVVLTNPEDTKSVRGFLRWLRQMELLEYAQNFLSGRNYESRRNCIYTIAGAFSGFRRSALKESSLYSSDTVCEDTHITFQLRKRYPKGIALSEDAFFITDGVEDFDKFYTQRQRWQRGELEIAGEFCDVGQGLWRGLLKDFVYRLLVFDHTFSFPRMIWVPMLCCLIFLNYPVKFVLGSFIIIYLLYLLCGYLRFWVGVRYLRSDRELRGQYLKRWYLVLFLPVFNLLQFLIRIIGIIHSIGSEQVWKGRTFSEEWNCCKEVIRSDFSKVIPIFRRIRGIFHDK